MYSLQKHAVFKTAGFDLGVWDQMAWNTLHGRPFWLTHHLDITNGLGDHTEFILLLVYPLYGLYNGPETLLVVQSIAVSLGAFPIYWWASTKLASQAAGLVYVLVYLLFPALEAAVVFDVHSLTLAVPFLTYALWAMYTQKYRLFAVAAILAMGCKENIPLLVFMMGLYILVVQRQRKVALITMLGSALWFVIVIYLVIPTFRPDGGNEYIYRYAAWGNSTGEIMLNVIAQPWKVIQVITAGDKLLYWIRLTLPVFFTALLDPLTLLLAAPILLLNTLGNYPAAYQLDLFHSSAPLAAYVTFASINGVSRLLRFAQPRLRYVRSAFLKSLLIIMIAMVAFVYQFQFGHTPIGRYFDWPVVTPHHQLAREMLLQIPPGVPVAAQNGLAPRLSHRQWLFILPNLSQGQVQAEYVVMNMQGNLDLHESIPKYCNQLNTLLTTPDYGLIFAEDGLLLFKKGVPDSATFNPMPPCL